MSYANLARIADITTEQSRLVAYAQYYQSLSIQGLHFVHFVPEHNAIALCGPDCSTHHEATAYLLLRKHANIAINTVRFEANNLKKFLDFLLLSEIDVREADLMVLLAAFADYLRLISITWRPRNVLEWITLEHVPLHEKASTAGRLIYLQRDKTGRLRAVDWSEYPDEMIERVVATAVRYLHFLQSRTVAYANLRLSDLPVKERYVQTILSGTAGTFCTTFYDVQAVTNTRRRAISRHVRLLPPDTIFTPTDVDRFMAVITNAQDRLLFSMLRCLGLRASEIAGVRLEVETLPTNLRRMELSKAKQLLRTQLRGDIQFITVPETALGRDRLLSTNAGYWWCEVVDRGNTHYRAGHKSHWSRHVPWLPHFRQSTFLNLLYEALLEREELIQYVDEDHGFLFVSRDHKARGRPLTGSSVAGKYTHIAHRLQRDANIDLLRFSPHTFRHFYATYLLKVLHQNIDDISRWLGHQSTETTRTTYLHWMPREEEHEEDGTVAATTEVLGRFSGDGQ
jgi:integrase